jgi:cytochrome c oxidase cbb3-type subunit III
MARLRQNLSVIGVLGGAALLGLVVAPAGSDKSRAPDATNGERVFNEYCAACHNKLEKVGSYLVDDTAYFVRAGVPAEAMGSLYRHPVRVRPPESRMPAFAPTEVSDADLDDMGLYLASQTPPPGNPPALGSAERGAPLYARTCAACHGAEGQGVKQMLPLAIFSNQLREAKAPPSVILGFVMLSTRSGSVPKMPSYSRETLSDRDLADIAAHIWSMPMPSPQPPG